MKGGDSGQHGSRSPWRYAGLGLQLAATLVVFVLLGQWLDRKVGTDGVFAILLVLVGFGGNLYLLIRELAAADKNGK